MEQTLLISGLRNVPHQYEYIDDIYVYIQQIENKNQSKQFFMAVSALYYVDREWELGRDFLCEHLKNLKNLVRAIDLVSNLVYHFAELCSFGYYTLTYYEHPEYRIKYAHYCPRFNKGLSKFLQLLKPDSIFHRYMMKFNGLTKDAEGTVSPVKNVFSSMKDRVLLNTDLLQSQLREEGPVTIVRPVNTPKRIAIQDPDEYLQYITFCIENRGCKLDFQKCEQYNKPFGPHVIAKLNDGHKYYVTLVIQCIDPIDAQHGTLNSCGSNVTGVILDGHRLKQSFVNCRSVTELAKPIKHNLHDQKKKVALARWVSYYRVVIMKMRDLLLLRNELGLYPVICQGCVTLEVAPHGDCEFICRTRGCFMCDKPICMKCQTDFHGNTPCDQARDEATEKFIRETTKTCPSCEHGVHKTEGCNHMQCRCGVDFCYQCGEQIVGSVTLHYDNDVSRSMGLNRECQQFP